MYFHNVTGLTRFCKKNPGIMTNSTETFVDWSFPLCITLVALVFLSISFPKNRGLLWQRCGSMVLQSFNLEISPTKNLEIPIQYFSNNLIGVSYFSLLLQSRGSKLVFNSFQI